MPKKPAVTSKSRVAEVVDLAETYVLLQGTREVQPIAGGPPFWKALMSGELPQVEQSRLVTLFDSDGAWKTWEIHPEGEELVVLLGGTVDFALEQQDGPPVILRLDRQGGSVIVPRGTWHTARGRGGARMLFITAGKGTQHRPRAKSDQLPWTHDEHPLPR